MSEPLIGEHELKYVVDCVRSGWISSAGAYIDAFERAWAAYCGRAHGIAVSSGTAALEIAMETLELQPGDEVIMPTFTIISCAQAVLRAGAGPVLVDSDAETWTMDVSQAAAAVTPRTRAVMPVHIYGQPVDMDPLLAIAAQCGLAIVEDAAEAHGAEYRSRTPSGETWRRCGSFGSLSCFSFYANKIVTTGEGGMVLTDDSNLAHRLRALRNLGFHPDRRFRHDVLGHNFRLTNVQAAIGPGQLERIDAILARKRGIAASYTARLRDMTELTLPQQASWAKHSYWMYGVVIDEATGFDAPRFAAALRRVGIDTRPFFLGMHEQPVFQRMGLFSGQAFPVAERLARQGLYLPSGLTLTDSQIDRVCDAVKRTLLP